MNCQLCQNEIEEKNGFASLSERAAAHLKTCEKCCRFQTERARLRHLIQSLPTVNAPTDFNFRVKSRLRRADTHTKVNAPERLSAMRKTNVAAATVGVLLILFVGSWQMRNSFFPVSEVSETETAAAAAAVSSKVDNPIAAAAPPPTPSQILPQPAPRQSVAPRNKTKRADNQKAKRDSQFIEIKEKPRSIDSAVGFGRQNTPRGIPNPLESPKKLDAQDLLKTFGVETETAADGLRVTKSARLQIKTGDIIEKINDKPPAELNANELKEIRLNVKRGKKNEEVKILQNRQN
jgi:hypothetical protein